MADSEGKNSESQAISLGIKWIKKNMPHIRLLVSYAGRKEGNYGYIYQATNWEYLGYFISEGFWQVNGEERHLNTLWNRCKKHGNPNLTFLPCLCEMYEDVRKTWTKQFIYITRLDKNLTPASEILEYPKPSNEFPIKTKEYIYKQNDEIFNNYSLSPRENVEYYYEKDEKLFTNAALIRQGKLKKMTDRHIAYYDIGGNLEGTAQSFKDINIPDYKIEGIRKSANTGSKYKQKYFRYYYEGEEPAENIEVPILCYIDEIPFISIAEMARYLGVTNQATSSAKQRRSKIIAGHNIEWID